jgi:hypothetical protein
MEVSFRVGPLAKRVRVFGERRWKRILWWHRPTTPSPFERIPLTYENAFGGKDTSPKNPKHHGQEPHNPVGRGYLSRNSKLKLPGLLLPNIEAPNRGIRRPGQRQTPQGFGFVGRDWHPRGGYTGTYDQKWQEERMPLLPLDFDERYHNAAHPDLIAPGFLTGGIPVEVIGCTQSGRLSFTLPSMEPSAAVTLRGVRQPITMHLNTVLVDANEMKLVLLWKGDLNVHHRLLQVGVTECRMVSG